MVRSYLKLNRVRSSEVSIVWHLDPRITWAVPCALHRAGPGLGLWPGPGCRDESLRGKPRSRTPRRAAPWPTGPAGGLPGRPTGTAKNIIGLSPVSKITTCAVASRSRGESKPSKKSNAWKQFHAKLGFFTLFLSQQSQNIYLKNFFFKKSNILILIYFLYFFFFNLSA